jgi:hypothetical protein
LDRIEKVYQKNRRYLRILFYKCLYFRREHGFFQKKKTFFVRLQQKKFLTGTQFPVFHTKVLHIAPEILPDVRIGNHAQYQNREDNDRHQGNINGTCPFYGCFNVNRHIDISFKLLFYFFMKLFYICPFC